MKKLLYLLMLLPLCNLSAAERAISENRIKRSFQNGMYKGGRKYLVKWTTDMRVYLQSGSPYHVNKELDALIAELKLVCPDLPLKRVAEASLANFHIYTNNPDDFNRKYPDSKAVSASEPVSAYVKIENTIRDWRYSKDIAGNSAIARGFAYLNCDSMFFDKAQTSRGLRYIIASGLGFQEPMNKSSYHGCLLQDKGKGTDESPYFSLDDMVLISLLYSKELVVGMTSKDYLKALTKDDLVNKAIVHCRKILLNNLMQYTIFAGGTQKSRRWEKKQVKIYIHQDPKGSVKKAVEAVLKDLKKPLPGIKFSFTRHFREGDIKIVVGDREHYAKMEPQLVKDMLNFPALHKTHCDKRGYLVKASFFINTNMELHDNSLRSRLIRPQLLHCLGLNGQAPINSESILTGDLHSPLLPKTSFPKYDLYMLHFLYHKKSKSGLSQAELWKIIEDNKIVTEAEKNIG